MQPNLFYANMSKKRDPYDNCMTSVTDGKLPAYCIQVPRPQYVEQYRPYWKRIQHVVINQDGSSPSLCLQINHIRSSQEHSRTRCKNKPIRQLQQQTNMDKCVGHTGFISLTHSFLVMGTVSVKGKSARGIHHLYFKHQQMTTGSVQIAFCFFANKVRI